MATPEFSTCTDMGNGASGANAAYHEYTYWINNNYAEPGDFREGHVVDTDPQYVIASWLGGSGFIWGFRYGGRGWC